MSLEKFFHLKENNTTVKTEIMAGVTSFMTMAYILAVNPNILAAAGMDHGAVFTATAVASFIGTLCMALFANYPFALAPGMGLNAYFAYTVVLGMGYSWEVALAAVLTEGIIFIILSCFNIREAIFNAIPFNLKKAVSVGIGLFITFLGLQNAKIVIACSNKKRGLGDSKYNERRSECETSLAELQQVVKIKTLGDLDEETFEKFKAIIKSDVRRKRAKHAVYENQRTIRAVEALKNDDVKLFGELMNASHVSLRDDYEVTGIELDTLVEEAWKVDGVIGSRMTGAGFGGCTVSIVKDEAIDTFIEQVGKAYKEKIGYAADFYVVEIGDGPQTL
mgnify:CR=1 FL=1